MKVVSGTQEGSTGMVVKVEQHVLIILSDITKEHVSDLFLLYLKKKYFSTSIGSLVDFRNSFLLNRM